MELSLETFRKMQPGEIFWTVTTQYHPLGTKPLTFVCVKGYANDWAVYYHNPHHGAEFIRHHGSKLASLTAVRYICPCTEDFLKLYRF